ncbi:hypothetical protein J7E28_19755 [Microbacterium sp. ISL-108]|uniref:hypothetical protein n=1 Tax=Microbacterium sp. ISL-108 TaxID=2819158 RepID=UPI0011C3EE76|nr:hypothetical protein [Microbacterium sp. ISL-108]MBT2486935.1 hypothetical protein [Microbacterium sp. ISL-108]
MKDGAKSLTTDVLPFLTTALQPDLSAGFFIRAYAISFAAAILVMVVILISLFVKTAKGEMAGRDLVQSLAQYAPLFLIGTMFGPLAGLLLVSLFHALTDSVIAWAMGSAQQIIDGLIALIDKIDPAATPGGVILAIILMLLLLIGLLFVIVILLCQLVTLYFTGVIIPLFLVFMIDPERRGVGLGMAGLWLGILAAHPLLFFLLGFAFSIMGDTIVTVGEKDGLQTLVTFVVALIAIYMAALSPLALMKFAPVLQGAFTPSSSGSGSSSGNTIGPSNITQAGNEYGNGGSETSSTTTTQTTQTTTGGSGSSTSTDSTDKTLSEASSTNESAPTSRETAPVGAGGSASGAGAAGSAEAAESGATGLAEAGAAESSTGAGAAVGVPTLIAAAGVAAAETAKKGADGAVAQATAPMEDSNTLGGSSV